MNLFPENFIHPKRNLPEIDPLGLEAFALSRGLQTHTALATAASCLLGAAGGTAAFWNSPFAARGALTLLVKEGDIALKMAIAELTSELEATQEKLISHAKTFTRAQIDDSMYQTGPMARNARELAQLGNPNPMARELYDDVQEGRLLADTEVPPQLVRYDGLTRPRVLISGMLPQSGLPKSLAECHDGRGLATGALMSLPASASKCREFINEVISCLHGISIELSPKTTRTFVTQEAASLSGIIRMAAADYDKVIKEHRALAGIVIPLVSPPLAAGKPVQEQPVDELHAHTFLEIFQRTSRTALAFRRAHTPLNFHFPAASHGEFLRRRRAYIRHLEDVPEERRLHGAANLPAALAWTLLTLAGRNPLDEYVMATAFESALKLHDEAVALFNVSDQAALAERQLLDARKMVARLASKGPSKRRALVRGFDHQSLHLHEPVFSILIASGMIIERPDRTLEVGTVPVSRLSANSFLPN